MVWSGFWIGFEAMNRQSFLGSLAQHALQTMVEVLALRSLVTISGTPFHSWGFEHLSLRRGKTTPNHETTLSYDLKDPNPPFPPPPNDTPKGSLAKYVGT